jgi:hypothetical protein
MASHKLFDILKSKREEQEESTQITYSKTYRVWTTDNTPEEIAAFREAMRVWRRY